MMPTANARLLAHLESIAQIPEQDRQAILALPVDEQDLDANTDIAREGDRPRHSCIVLQGFTVMSKLTGAGDRQISAHYIPGDMPDLQSLHLPVMDSTLTAVCACKIGFVDHQVLRDLCHAHPDLAAALWRMTLIDGAIYREWITNLGQRAAYGRVAHVLAETFARMRAVGLTVENSCVMPLTQIRLAEATGMSTVHVNRIVQELRGDGIVDLDRGSLEILDWDKLTDVSDFDPAYLHLRSPPFRRLLEKHAQG